MKEATGTVAIVGTGFVADLYMGALKTFPGIKVVGAFDINGARLKTFCDYWGLSAASSLDALLASDSETPPLILNLTNPHAHFAVSKAALEAGCHVYSEKPLAMRMEDALALGRIAAERDLMLASAPCSWLSETGANCVDCNLHRRYRNTALDICGA